MDIEEARRIIAKFNTGSTGICVDIRVSEYHDGWELTGAFPVKDVFTGELTRIYSRSLISPSETTPSQFRDFVYIQIKSLWDHELDEQIKYGDAHWTEPHRPFPYKRDELPL